VLKFEGQFPTPRPKFWQGVGRSSRLTPTKLSLADYLILPSPIFSAILKVMNKPSLRAMAILVGTTIGAGIYGIPYAVAKVGFLPGLIYLFVLAGIILILNLLYGEVILRTEGHHQLTGYGRIYLGRCGFALATSGLFISLYGALLAYLIKIGEFGSLILNFPHPTALSLIFFLLALVAIHFGLKTVSVIDLILVGLVLASVSTMGLLGLRQISWANLNQINLGLNTLFLPYGVILFALTGSTAIPEMKEVLQKEPGRLKKAIITGTLIPLFVYIFFAFVVVGICGLKTSDDAISGLTAYLPGWIVYLGAGLAILTMTTSFLSIGLVLKEAWYRDFKQKRLIALALALFPSLIFFLIGAKNFISILEVTGALTGGLTGILIILLHQRAKQLGQKQPIFQLYLPKIVYWILGVVFFLGVFSSLA
jgi:tyrosine-specific transport protein